MNRRDPLSFKDWQRDAAHARAAVIQLVHRLTRDLAVTTDGAIDAVNRSITDGTADATTVRLLDRANVRRREGRGTALNRATFFRWKRAFEVGGVDALAPEETHREKLPAWARLALDLYRQPSKPSVQYVVEKLPAALAAAQLSIEPPSYGQVNRFLRDKVGTVARNAGRLGPKELKAISPFVRRDTSKLWPADVYTSDGHTFKAEVAHPAHGRPFRPEITTVLDVATRKCVGWSTALDENSYGVLEAQRRAFTTHGVCAIWYVDRGAGFDNALQKDPLVGMAARIGFEVRHSLPYNSQARGLEERSHQTILVRAAKQLPTFVGAAMDREAKNRVFKLVRRDIKSVGVSRHLMPWDAFPAYIQQAIDDYNARPHRSLARVRGDDGRLRHLSPNEAWVQAQSDGFTPTLIGQDEARDLFWPQRAVKCIRGEIRLFGKTYFHAGLAEYHDEVLRAGYDLVDPRVIVVRDLQGRFLCEAQVNGNLRDYFSESVLAEAARKRAEGRLRRIDIKRDEIEAELAGQRVIEHAPSPRFEFTDIEAVPVQVAAAPADSPSPQPSPPVGGEGEEPAARPFFEFSGDRYEWLMQHRGVWTDADRAFVRHYTSSEEYSLLVDMYAAQGIAWDGKSGEDPTDEGFNEAVR